MAGVPTIGKLSGPQQSALAALVAGATPAQIANICAATMLKQVACPAFTAGAATLAMGTSKASECVVESTRTLAQASTLTLAVTDAVQGFFYVTVRALTLGYTLAIVNGGPLAGTLATVAASLDGPVTICLFFDGTNFFYEGLGYVS